MYELQQKATDVVLADPAVAGLGSSIGTSAWNASVNRGQLFISLKPLAERGGLTAEQVSARLRERAGNIPGLRVFFYPMQDIRVGGRSSDSSYQYTLWDADYGELLAWAPRIFDKIKTVPGLADVSIDREQGGLQVNVDDRPGGGVAARRARAGYLQRAQQLLQPAADLDALHPAQPVPRHPGDRSALPARPDRPRPHLCERRQQHAGAAQRRDQDQPRAVAAGGQPPGPVPGDHHQLQPRSRHHHPGRDPARRPRGRRAAHSRFAACRICRRRPRPTGNRSARSRS